MKSRVKFLCAASALAAALCLPAGASAESMSIESGSYSTAPSNLKAGAHADFRTKFSFDLDSQLPYPFPRGGSVRDFQAFARQTGNELLEQLQNDAEYVHFLRRR